MAELFDKAKSTINEHIKNAFKEGELVEERGHEKIRKFRIFYEAQPTEVEKHFIEAEKEIKQIESTKNV